MHFESKNPFLTLTQAGNPAFLCSRARVPPDSIRPVPALLEGIKTDGACLEGSATSETKSTPLGAI
jgi:hypothetical protein